VIRALVVFALAAGLGAPLASCGSTVEPDQPPEIVYGEDVCDQCGMIISDPRFAAATIVDTGRLEARRFDDISDMFAYHRTHHDLPVRSWWVHDYETEEWLDAVEAIYVRSPEIRSPMAGGVVAFATEAQATAFATTVGGEILGFDALQAADANMSPHH
jgi:copper chaperone NosL